MESPSDKDRFRIVDPVTDSNCYGILRGDRCLVIDPNDYSQLKPLLQKWGVRSPLVLLTHEHCDHIGALNALRDEFTPLVVASRACGEGMQSMKENMSRMMEMFLYYKSKCTRLVSYEPFSCRPADVLFSEELSFPFGGGRVWMKSLPGHTHGSSV
ncbi:MAG: MBL fold metallo-hydrolase, partial [Clostridiales bacterium]|nr:MBL fold metallo-hydrolase [Clostridiales bacterium]